MWAGTGKSLRSHREVTEKSPGSHREVTRKSQGRHLDYFFHIFLNGVYQRLLKDQKILQKKELGQGMRLSRSRYLIHHLPIVISDPFNKITRKQN